METRKENAEITVEIIFWKWKVKQTQKQTEMVPIRDNYHKQLELPRSNSYSGRCLQTPGNNTKLAEVPKVYVTEMTQQSLGLTIVSLGALDRTMEKVADGG